MSARPFNNWYILKWWLLTVVIVAPGIVLITTLLSGGNPLMWLILPYGIFFSVPTLIIAYMIFQLIKYFMLPPKLARIILNVVALAGILFTFSYLLDSALNYFSLVYCFATLVANLAFRLTIPAVSTTTADVQTPQ